MKAVFLRSKHKCKRDEKGVCIYPSKNLRCFKCKALIHVHLEDLELIPDNKLIGSRCIFCGAINHWVKVPRIKVGG